MSYKVISPLVVIAPGEKSSDLGDSNNGPRYFYDGAIIPDGYNDERCKQLAEEGMLEAVKADSSAKEPTVKEILDEVGEDKDKAAAALEQEKAGKNRTTLVGPLEAIVNG